MLKVTRLKVLQTTLPFGTKQLIFLNRNSSLNNYSTSLMGNYYPAPLTNSNNTRKNLFAVKYYSTSTLLVDNNTTPPTTTLDPTLIKKWTKEEVCSLLCTDKEKGGAGLTVEEVKRLYDVGFKGASIANIVTCIQDKDMYFAIDDCYKDFPNIPRGRINTVVIWVDNLLKTRLYHLWSTEHARKQLCEPVLKGGAGLSKDNADMILGLIDIHCIFNDFRRDGLENTLDTLYKKHENVPERTLKAVVEWINNCKIEYFKKPLQDFIGPTALFGQSPPYQNNKSNVLRVAQKLLENLKLKENGADPRFQNLIINFAYYGFGKTRFGAQFLDLFKQYLQENLCKKNELIDNYGKHIVDKLENTELVYLDLSIDFKSYEARLTYLQNMIPTNKSSYFVVLDEYPSFCSFSQENVTLLFKIYSTWLNSIFSIQILPNVAGVYVCGRGTFLDLFSKSSFIQEINNVNLRSPTLCFRVELYGLTRDNLISIFSEQIPQYQAKLEQKGLYEFFLDEIMEETAGIPLLIEYVIQHIHVFCPLSKEDIIQFFDTVEKKVPERILYPFGGVNSFSCQLYTFLMFISQMVTALKSDLKFNTTMFDLTKIAGLEDVKEVDLSTLAVALNCYVTNENNGNIRLAFPRRTIRMYLGLYGTSFSIQQFVKIIPQFLDKGAIFEVLVGSFIVWKSKLGLLQNRNFGSVFPFLTRTTLGDKSCIDLHTMVTSNRTIDNAKSEWNKVHLNFGAYKNRLSFMKEKTRGPDTFVVFEQDLWWCIQHKNKSFSFTKLYGEIDKLNDFPPSVKIIFTMFYRCKLEKEILGVFNEGSIIKRPKVEGSGRAAKIQQIKVPKNVTLVVVDEDGIRNLIGESNYLALVELSTCEIDIPKLVQ